jgi:hypothetical protein
MMQSPLGAALVLLTVYYAAVGVLQKARSRRGGEAWIGAALFAGLTTAVAAWPVAAAIV